MRYSITDTKIPQKRRAEINNRILFSIDAGKGEIPLETIYNTYTGIGALHNLKAEDYANYNEFSHAKKEAELGQFFTPHHICREMVGIAAPEPTEMVLEMCCGSGNFLNHLPNLYNAYGFDVDENAVKVAKHLYPEAQLEVRDIRSYRPEQRFDVLIGNPPFNLDFDGQPSQLFYCNKAYWVLNPGGIMVLIVPASFLQSDLWDKSNISLLNNSFTFVGQSRLPSNAFASVGVANFDTKIMVFLRSSEHIPHRAYQPEEFVTTDELAARVKKARELKRSLRLKLMQEGRNVSEWEMKEIEYKLTKYLYELKTHPHLLGKYDKALALVTKFRNQRPPVDCSAEEEKEWEKRKLKGPQVLSILKRYISRQYEVPRREVALVKTSYGFKLKGYAPRILDKAGKQYVSINDLILNRDTLPVIPCRLTKKHKEQYRAAKKFIERKQRQFRLQDTPFDELERDPALDAYINSLTFLNKKKQVCRFNDIQKHDMGLLYRKRYSHLNWEPGSGKTGVMYHFGQLLLDRHAVKNVVVLAPALAANTTWKRFLQRNGVKFTIAKNWDAIANVEQGAFILLSISMTGKMKRGFSQFMKLRSNKICFLFDESDNITNPSAKRTRYSLSIFRRSAYKMLGTGTMVRNNVNESYPQFEMLYNNSVNMMCMCQYVYYENRETKTISCAVNEKYGRPFPAHGGMALFKACFNPGKATVFGINKVDQDIYNRDELWRLIRKTVITRTFKEIAGDKYSLLNVPVTPNVSEMAVYRKVMDEYQDICYTYFNNSGDTRKESSLKILRQIELLIKACSIPHLMPGYHGDHRPTKPKAILKHIDSVEGKVAVGCTTHEALEMYADYISDHFPDRPLFIIHGGISFSKREKLIDKFEDTTNGILVCTQQSLELSIDIPSCNEVLIESLPWNYSRVDQFTRRFCRYDSEEHTYVRLFTNENSIEQNLLALILDKERLNGFVKTGEVADQDQIYADFGIDRSIVQQLYTKGKDTDGRTFVNWGNQQVYSYLK